MNMYEGIVKNLKHKQLINNLEHIIYGYQNGMNDVPSIYPPLTKEQLIDYCLEEVFDIKDDGMGGTTIKDGICDDLKFLGNDLINSEIIRIGKEAEVLADDIKETEDSIDFSSADPEEIDDYYSDQYYEKTQKETDPEKKFEYACYTAASQWMSTVTEETSKDFIEGMLLPVAKNAYNSPNHSDEDYLNEIISDIENGRGSKFDFNKED